MRVKTEQNMWNITFQRPWKINEKLDAPIENLLFYFHCFAMSTFYWDAPAQTIDEFISKITRQSLFRFVANSAALRCGRKSARPLSLARKLVDEMFQFSEWTVAMVFRFPGQFDHHSVGKSHFLYGKLQTWLKSLCPWQPETRKPSGTFISR